MCSGEKIRLNLGCGGDVREGFTNIDLYAEQDDSILKADVRELHKVYQPRSVDEIVAQDVLEHISHREAQDVLSVWCDLLKPGGRIEIRVPDLTKQIEMFQSGVWDITIFNHMAYAGQEHPGNYHCCAYTMPWLQYLLENRGIVITNIKYLHHGLTNNIKTSNNPNLLVIGEKAQA